MLSIPLFYCKPISTLDNLSLRSFFKCVWDIYNIVRQNIIKLVDQYLWYKTERVCYYHVGLLFATNFCKRPNASHLGTFLRLWKMCFSWSVEGGWFVLYLKRVLLLLYLWLKGHWTTTITMLWNKKLSGMFVVGYNHVLKSDYVGNSFKIILNALTLIRKVAFEIGVIFCLFCCFLENLIFKKKSFSFEK